MGVMGGMEVMEAHDMMYKTPYTLAAGVIDSQIDMNYIEQRQKRRQSLDTLYPVKLTGAIHLRLHDDVQQEYPRCHGSTLAEGASEAMELAAVRRSSTLARQAHTSWIERRDTLRGRTS